MSAPTRQAMRFLSPRLQSLRRRQPPAPSLRQIRHASGRYSSPGRRTVATAPDASILVGAEEATASQAQHNPLDARAARAAWLEKRQFHMRRMRFAGMGLLMSIAGLAMILFNLNLDDMERAEQERKQKGGVQLEAPDEANKLFQGRDVHVIGAGEDKRIVAGDGTNEIELVETGTSSVPHFPRTIFLPPSASAEQRTVGTSAPNSPDNPGNTGNQEEYTLVGLGIRTVMWIQVYVVGLYVRTKDISTMQEKLIRTVNPSASTLIPAEKDALKAKLLDPQLSREVWSEMLQTPGSIRTAWRISPTRNTDFGHLRDGFVNGINKGKAEQKQALPPTTPAGGETEYDTEEFGAAVQQLRAIFTGGKAPKQSVLLLVRDELGRLDVLYEGKPEGERDGRMERMGSVADERISRLIWLNYLAGAKVSSPATRDGVAQGCVEWASRPIGSVETRVI